MSQKIGPPRSVGKLVKLCIFTQTVLSHEGPVQSLKDIYSSAVGFLCEMNGWFSSQLSSFCFFSRPMEQKISALLVQLACLHALFKFGASKQKFQTHISDPPLLDDM